MRLSIPDLPVIDLSGAKYTRKTYPREMLVFEKDSSHQPLPRPPSPWARSKRAPERANALGKVPSHGTLTHLSARFPAHLEKQATMPVNSDPIHPSRAWGSIYIFKGPGKC